MVWAGAEWSDVQFVNGTDQARYDVIHRENDPALQLLRVIVFLSLHNILTAISEGILKSSRS
jgi:hypothetical protein